MPFRRQLLSDWAWQIVTRFKRFLRAVTIDPVLLNCRSISDVDAGIERRSAASSNSVENLFEPTSRH
jgi:hypothetical protein